MDLVGKWTLVKKDGFVEAMKKFGIPQIFISLSDDIALHLEITQDGDTYIVKQRIYLKLNEYTFKSGQKFDVKNWLGKQVQGSVAVKSNNTMVENITEGGVSTSVTTTIDNRNLVRTCEMGGVKCKLTYTKV